MFISVIRFYFAFTYLIDRWQSEISSKVDTARNAATTQCTLAINPLTQ